MTTQELLTRLHNHILVMAPHQAEREAGKLLVESEREIRRLLREITHMEREAAYGPDVAHSIRLREEDEARTKAPGWRFIKPPQP